jgi:hypothetical protein
MSLCFQIADEKAKILGYMVVSISQILSAFNFFVNAILICYFCSQVFEFWNIFKVFISFFYIMTLSHSLVMRNSMYLVFSDPFLDQCSY